MSRMKISVTLDGPEWSAGWQSGEVADVLESYALERWPHLSPDVRVEVA